jgi:non-specific protein-tyrosine kinase
MTLNLVTLNEPASPAAEAYRRLRVNLSAERELPLRTILVVPVDSAADKDTVAANLAVAYARVGKQVILADCDLRRPRQHTVFGAANEAGVTTSLADEAAPLPLQETAVPGLRLLTSGPDVEVPSDLLASPAMGRLMARLCEAADVVLLDAPPVAVATDASELANQVDGVLLTVTAGQTKRDAALRARQLLEQVGARIVGAVLVNVPLDAALRKYAAG